MRWPVLALILPLFAPTRAEATGCFLGPYSLTINPPLGCEVVVARHADAPDSPITVTARRGQQEIDVTGSITSSTTMLDVSYINYACDGSVIVSYTQSEGYNIYRITLAGAEVGDLLKIDGGLDSGYVAPAGPCTEDAANASPACTGLNSGYPCDPVNADAGVGGGSDQQMPGEPGGCRATGGSAGIALALLAFAQRRRRRAS